MNIKIRDEKLWQQRVEIEDLKEQLDREKIRKFEKTILLESKPTILGMIPISKLKEKIEELNKEEKKTLKGTKGQDRYSIKLEYMHKRNALQELLEESDK